MSSVRFDGESMGFAAAGLLDRLMRGDSVDQTEVLFLPKGIVVRGSSGEDRLALLVVHVFCGVGGFHDYASQFLLLSHFQGR
jgi:hypothetical protein